MIIQSKITKVTVYSDRAEVTRSTENELAKGDHTLIFDLLPDSTERNSIQVRGNGAAVLKDVKFRTVYFDEHPDSDLTAFNTEESALTDRISELEDTIKHSEQEKSFIENITVSITSYAGESHTPEIDPQKWIKMVEFYRNKLDTLDRDIRAAQKEKSNQQNKLNRLSREIKEIAGRNRKQKNQVEASVMMKDSGKLILDLSYIVYGPSWQPVYNLSTSSADKTMTLSYNALIQQNTSEDWNDTAVKLSTARPNVNGQQPELTPWHLSLYQPSRIRSAAAPELPSARPAAMTQMFKASEEEEFYEDECLAELEIPESSVETGITSAVFTVNGISTIKSDNQQYKVTILIQDFPAIFRYSSVPKLSPYAYLKARVKNDTDFPLLPGETNVFLDNNFVATAYQELAAPAEEFWTFLGIDESITVDHKFIKKFTMTEGIISKTTVTRYEYMITIKNKKKSEEEVVIWDQLPISGNEEIKVVLIEPAYKTDSANLKINESRFIEWYFKLKPGEEIKVPLIFSVEYPKNAEVSGLI